MLLNSYKERTYKEAVLQKKDERKELLDRCLNELKSYERDLVCNLCLDGVSERDYARTTGLSRHHVRCEKERILTMIASVFTEYFAPKEQRDEQTLSDESTAKTPMNEQIDTLSARPKI